MSQKPENLPASNDKKFWGEDALMASYQQTEDVVTKTHGEFYKIGSFIVCGRCDGSHTISFDPKKYKIVEGKLQRILTTAQNAD